MNDNDIGLKFRATISILFVFSRIVDQYSPTRNTNDKGSLCIEVTLM